MKFNNMKYKVTHLSHLAIICFYMMGALQLERIEEKEEGKEESK